MIPNNIYENIKDLDDEETVLQYLYKHGYSPGLADEALVEWRSYKDPSMIIEKIEQEDVIHIKVVAKPKEKKKETFRKISAPTKKAVVKEDTSEPIIDFANRSFKF